MSEALDTSIFFQEATQNNHFQEPLTCEAGLQTFLNSSSDTLNFYSVGCFFFYALCSYGIILLYEKKQLSTKLYVRFNRALNNIFLTVAVIYLIYGWLLA